MDKLISKLRDSYLIESVQRKHNTVTVHHRDISDISFKIQKNNGNIEVIEIDTVGGGRIGGIVFKNDEYQDKEELYNAVFSHVTSI